MDFIEGPVLKLVIKVLFYLISLVGIKACLYNLLQLYRIDPRIPEVYAIHLKTYENYPLVSKIHLIGGILFVLIMGLQFSDKIRTRYKRIHKILGTFFLIVSFSLIITGLKIGFTFPFAGTSEQIPMVLFSLMFIYYLYRSIDHLLKKDFYNHSRWMIRSCSLALSVATQRILVTSFSILKIGEHREIFVISIYLSIIINVIVSEFYLKLSKKKLI